jgi:hypothetical protein
LIPEELRKYGVRVEPHAVWFRHNTEDTEWLAAVGEKKWVVLSGDVSIGRRPLELDALLTSKVKAFVLTHGHLHNAREQAQMLAEAMPQILQMVQANHFPFIAKIHQDKSVELWKTDVEFTPGLKYRKRFRPPKQK